MILKIYNAKVIQITVMNNTLTNVNTKIKIKKNFFEKATSALGRAGTGGGGACRVVVCVFTFVSMLKI